MKGGHHKAAAQARRKRNFDACVRPVPQAIAPGTHVYVRKEYINPQKERKHKLSSVAEGPYEVLDTNADRVVINDGSRVERLSRDRVVLAPSSADTYRTTHSQACIAPPAPLERLNRGLLDLLFMWLRSKLARSRVCK